MPFGRHPLASYTPRAMARVRQFAAAAPIQGRAICGSLRGVFPVATLKTISPSKEEKTGKMARAMPAPAMLASRLHCLCVRAASVATTQSVVFARSGAANLKAGRDACPGHGCGEPRPPNSASLLERSRPEMRGVSDSHGTDRVHRRQCPDNNIRAVNAGQARNRLRCAAQAAADEPAFASRHDCAKARSRRAERKVLFWRRPPPESPTHDTASDGPRPCRRH